MHIADAHASGYTCIVSMCVPWKSNLQPFALLTQCSTTEPQDIFFIISNFSYFILTNCQGNISYLAIFILFDLNIFTKNILKYYL